MGILDHETILKLHQAVIDARLVDSRDALLAGLDAGYVAGLPAARGPAQQVLQDLDAFNETGALADGSVPLTTWLANGVQLAGPKVEAGVFEEALARCRAANAMPKRASIAVADASRHSASEAAPAVTYHHHGDVIMGGDKYTSNITGSTIGAVSIGDHATATGTVNVHHGPPTQAAHVAQVKAAQKALIDDEERLDTLVFEALNQFLRLARDIQVEQRSLAETQARMKATLDEVWAAEAAKGLRPQLLPKGLEVVDALAKSEVMAEVVKKLVGG